jgi:hypothetical protein
MVLAVGLVLPAARALLYSMATTCLTAAALLFGFLLRGRPLDDVALNPPLTLFTMSLSLFLLGLAHYLAVGLPLLGVGFLGLVGTGMGLVY